MSHCRVCDVASFGLHAGEVILDHGHARVSWLHNVVILDCSEVEQRFFLNRLAGRLLLWLNGRLETTAIAAARSPMVPGLLPIALAAILLLDESGRLVH